MARKWRSAGWFLLLWAGGVGATLAVAAVFKILMLGAVRLG